MPGQAQGYNVPPQSHSTPMQQGVPTQPGYSPQVQGMAGPGAQVPYNPQQITPQQMTPQQMGATGASNDGLATSSVANNLGAAGHAGSPQNLSNSAGVLSSPEKGSSSGATSQTTDPHVSREQGRQISLLLAELDASKDLNEKVHSNNMQS